LVQYAKGFKLDKDYMSKIVVFFNFHYSQEHQKLRQMLGLLLMIP